MGRVEIDWRESSEELRDRYQEERHHQRRPRLQALWKLRQGKRIEDVAEITRASCRSVQQWL